MSLQRKAGLPVVIAIVVGNIIGSGIFFTPGELAGVAANEWQIYFVWTLCGLVTLCGALTLAELATLLPRSGVFYHTLHEAYGPLAGFIQGWIQVLISGPGSIAGIAILFGEFASQIFGTDSPKAPVLWGSAAIGFFVSVNLRGISWGGRTQVLLTAAKFIGLALLIFGGVFLALPATTETAISESPAEVDLAGLFQFTGLGIAIVFFTYDGWIDATHIAGEVQNPERTFPRAMGLGVFTITTVYLLVNYAFLRVVSLSEMQTNPAAVATTVASAAYGAVGASAINVLMWVSIFGALGGLIMTLPRLCQATILGHVEPGASSPVFIRWMVSVSRTSSVPTGATIFVGAGAILALLFFGSFSRIVSFVLVPLQAISMMMISTIFILRSRLSKPGSYKAPGYPWLPLLYLIVVGLLLLNAIIYNPADTLIGLGVTGIGVLIYYGWGPGTGRLRSG